MGGGLGGGFGRPAAAGQDADLAGGEVSILVPGAGPGPAGPGLHLGDPSREQPRGGGSGPAPSVSSVPPAAPQPEHSPHNKRYSIPQRWWLSLLILSFPICEMVPMFVLCPVQTRGCGK